MFRPLTDRLPRLGRWPRLALVGCCLLLALDSAVTAHARGAKPVAAGAEAVIVAARPLTAGARLTAADVRVARWPRIAIAVTDLRHRGDVVGRRLVTAVARGEAISSTRLLGRDLSAGLSAGQVAVPVQVADPHAGDLLHAGDRVALYTAPRTADGVAVRPSDPDDSTVLATGLRVLAVLTGNSDTADDGAELVVAAGRSTALRLTRADAARVVTAVAEPP